MPNITVTVNIPESVVEQVVKGIMSNYPEANCGNTIQCIAFHYPDKKPLSEWRFKFEEGDNGKVYELDGKKLVETFPLLFGEEYQKCKGLRQPPASPDPELWDQWLCACDPTEFDAFVQLACLGKIIYG